MTIQRINNVTTITSLPAFNRTANLTEKILSLFQDNLNKYRQTQNVAYICQTYDIVEGLKERQYQYIKGNKINKANHLYELIQKGNEVLQQLWMLSFYKLTPNLHSLRSYNTVQQIINAVMIRHQQNAPVLCKKDGLICKSIEKVSSCTLAKPVNSDEKISAFFQENLHKFKETQRDAYICQTYDVVQKLKERQYQYIKGKNIDEANHLSELIQKGNEVLQQMRILSPNKLTPMDIEAIYSFNHPPKIKIDFIEISGATYVYPDHTQLSRLWDLYIKEGKYDFHYYEIWLQKPLFNVETGQVEICDCLPFCKNSDQMEWENDYQYHEDLNDMNALQRQVREKIGVTLSFLADKWGYGAFRILTSEQVSKLYRELPNPTYDGIFLIYKNAKEEKNESINNENIDHAKENEKNLNQLLKLSDDTILEHYEVYISYYNHAGYDLINFFRCPEAKFKKRFFQGDWLSAIFNQIGISRSIQEERMQLEKRVIDKLKLVLNNMKELWGYSEITITKNDDNVQVKLVYSQENFENKDH